MICLLSTDMAMKKRNITAMESFPSQVSEEPNPRNIASNDRRFFSLHYYMQYTEGIAEYTLMMVRYLQTSLIEGVEQLLAFDWLWDYGLTQCIRN